MPGIDLPVLPPIDVAGGLLSRPHSPSNLRKSISVDSFVRHSRSSINSSSSAGTTHPAVVDERGEHLGTISSAPSWRSDFSSLPPSPDYRSTFSRPRSSSYIPPACNLDGVLSTAISTKPRHPLQDSVRTDKGREKLHSAHMMDESSLPSPTSSSPALSGFFRMRPSILQDHAHIAQPGPSQTASRKSISARSRSSSFGVNNSNGTVAMVISTQIPTSLPVTVAVVGTKGSGKSTVIRKGCKAYGMSDPTVENQKAFKYTSRVGRTHQHQNSVGTLRVVEVDLEELNRSNSSSSMWPESAPRIDGVIVCYDASNIHSFAHVETLINGYERMRLPVVVMACKSDADKKVDPQVAASMLQKYHVGLVEVTASIEQGKAKMRRCFDWMIQSIYRERSSNRHSQNSGYRNPASPDILVSPVNWEDSRTSNNTPIPSSSQQQNSRLRSSQSSSHVPASIFLPSPPSSPTHSRSPRLENERTKPSDIEELNGSQSTVTRDAEALLSRTDRGDTGDKPRKGNRQDQRLAAWAYLDELLNKLMFSVVTDDDNNYIWNFLLTYRRFASPRTLLLTMQKRMRHLDDQTSDPMFVCLAQMNLCRLLSDWIHDYPYDFAVRGTAGALSALVKSIISKTHLIHYGLEFLPFLEVLPNLIDQDARWALKIEDYTDESDDSYSMFEEDEDLRVPESDSPVSSAASFPNSKLSMLPPAPPVLRERKQSLPLTAKSIVMPVARAPNSNVTSVDSVDLSMRSILRELSKISQELNEMDTGDVAQEITRIETKLFIDIKPRHWLKHTLQSGNKDPETDTIARFGHVSNHIADWVVSLILCHDKPKNRAKQIEKFIDIGLRLRTLNNYSALRGVVAGINSATFVGDETMQIFKARNPDAWKLYQSWDLLFQASRSHRAYRLALKNSKGACIPALEVHLLDLIRAHEGNPDYSTKHTSKIHWAKYNMMGKFIAGTVQSQEQCRTSGEYKFEERPHIRDLLLKECLLDTQMQRSRIAAPPVNIEGNDQAPVKNVATPELPSYPRDAALLRRILFWAS